MRDPDEETAQFETFRDCLSAAVVERVTRPAPKPKRRAKKANPTPHAAAAAAAAAGGSENGAAPSAGDAPVDAADMMDFTSYLAAEAFDAFPADLRALTHAAYAADPSLRSRYGPPLSGADAADILPALSPDVADSLVAYGLVDPDRQGAHEFLAPVLAEYVAALTAAPPPPRSTRDRAAGCELCGRDWIGLTYHHLVPRAVHEKAVRRGWRRPDELDSVAWLCRLCHSFVHRFAGHEDLARRYHTVELLLAQDEVVRFAQYASRVRWKGR